MLSRPLKSDIRRLWDRFWSGGIANPLTAIEQITYLVFLKQQETQNDERAKAARSEGREYNSIYDEPGGEQFRWSYIRELSGQEQLRHVQGPVFEWLRRLDSTDDRMRDAVFVISNPNLLQGAIETIDNLYIPSHNQDTLGDIYEMLLSEIAEAGKNGQFRTPRHIIRAMCDLVDPRLGDRICDPACGTGGFLVNTFQHVLKRNTTREKLRFEADGTALYATGDNLSAQQHKELRENHFYGWDFDRTMVRLGWMNMIQHGITNPQIHYADTLGSAFNRRLLVTGGDVGNFDVVLANPPFTGSVDKSDIGESLGWLGTTKTELLFLELIMQLLRVGGRAAVIVPEGLLFGSTGAHRKLRQKLVQENQLNAVISLPGGVFQPYTGVKTSILTFVRGGSTDRVWFYEVEADGLSLNARRTEQYDKNDLWDMTLKYQLNLAAFHQPAPAFIGGDTWRAWQTFDKETRTRRYLQPLIGLIGTESEGERIEAQELLDFHTQEATKVKDWSAERTKLKENNENLAAGRYKPLVPDTIEYDAPELIIRELQELELQITDGLKELLTMVEE